MNNSCNVRDLANNLNCKKAFNLARELRRLDKNSPQYLFKKSVLDYYCKYINGI